MPISQDLMLALLSMDSYNRGLNTGLDLSAWGASSTNLGNATIEEIPEDIDIANWITAGFSAQAYTWNGKTVISYRGTDNPSFLASPNGPSDIVNGWIAGVGVPIPMPA
jgi:hypothetical protein